MLMWILMEPTIPERLCMYTVLQELREFFIEKLLNKA